MVQSAEEFIREHLDDDLWDHQQAAFAVKLRARDVAIRAEERAECVRHMCRECVARWAGQIHRERPVQDGPRRPVGGAE